MNAPTLLRADARDLPLAEQSVDLVVTSPPYFGLRSYTDNGEHYERQIGSEATPQEFVNALIAVTRECVRVLKPSGSIWVNLGDKYVADNRGSGSGHKRGEAKWAPAGAAGYPGEGIMPRKSLMGLPWRYALRCIDDLGLILRAEVVWSKPNGMPESVTDRVRRSHETWFHFVVSPRYYSAVDEIREPTSGYSRPPTTGTREARGGQKARTMADACNPLGKLPGSVWEVATQPLHVPAELGIDHFAAFPMEWPRRIVRAWSPEGGTVLDPFGGTGTTAMVAAALGRRGVSVDASADYCRLAQWRTGDPKERARAAGLDASVVQQQIPGQQELFSEGDAA